MKSTTKDVIKFYVTSVPLLLAVASLFFSIFVLVVVLGRISDAPLPVEPEEPGLNIEVEISRPPEWSPVESLDEFSDDYLRSACRLRGGGSGGSGTCYKIDNDFVYVLTCRHVVGRTKKFICDFS